jgi:uncharacterized protein YjbJ (UPF0337 family)
VIPNEEIEMTWGSIESNWQQLEANLRARWGKLTEDDLEGIAGQRDKMIDKLRALYGLTEDRAEAELRDWERHQEPIAPTA